MRFFDFELFYRISQKNCAYEVAVMHFLQIIQLVEQQRNKLNGGWFISILLIFFVM